MKKTNNKFRNNSNQIYSLNYKFDSISIAGKISGTALDLIKKYNELAKEALGNNDYVTAEIFRQYAEHYRKIVTEINEKKNAQKIIAFQKATEVTSSEDGSYVEETNNIVSNDNLDEDSQNLLCNNEENSMSIIEEHLKTEDVVNEKTETVSEKKEFKVIEISSSEEGKLNPKAETMPKTRTRRVSRKKETVAV